MGHIFNSGGNNVGDIFNSVGRQMWGTVLTMFRDECGGHFQLVAGQLWGIILTLLQDKSAGYFQLCYGTNAGDIFNTVAGQM